MPRRFYLADFDQPCAAEDECFGEDAVMFAADLAFSGGLLEEMPADVDEAIEAFEEIQISVQEVS